ncbi:MAG: hypothetical protein VR69_14720 [Peptococcaceae bacterium BRH_c4b]|nr:MAG: hypothetical protein VR69_14720 [Peptococcaceae bacterium BRH_c4b]
MPVGKDAIAVPGTFQSQSFGSLILMLPSVVVRAPAPVSLILICPSAVVESACTSGVLKAETVPPPEAVVPMMCLALTKPPEVFSTSARISPEVPLVMSTVPPATAPK